LSAHRSVERFSCAVFLEKEMEQMAFSPEEIVFHREEYIARLAQMRAQDYPPLSKREVVGEGHFSHRRANPYAKDGKALVSLAMSDGDLESNIQKTVDLLGGLDKALRPGDHILLKPNFNSDDPPPGSTALDFLCAVIHLLRRHGHTKISVGEGSGRPWVPTAKVFEKTGLPEKMKEMGVPLLDFDQSEYVDVPVHGDYLDVIAYARDLETFDKIIYLPTMKTHFLAGFSMSLKLTVGLVHLCDRAILHGDNNLFVAQRAAEMNIPIKPDLIIMDGRISFVSGGPAVGLAVHPGVIVASGDPVAMDVQGIRLLQNYAAVNHLAGSPWDLPQIRTAARHGLGVQKDREWTLVR